MIDLPNDNLIFLISQPRAGSTLLQRILGSHPQVHTISEPWLMLHPLYALHSEGHEAEYNAHLAHNALRNLLQVLPEGEDEYIEGVRRMYTYLYEQTLASSGKRYFLDKTPRYYFIILELHRVFPNARYIILLRNPLAVLCSVLKTWVGEDWLSLYCFRHDLTRAPHFLLEGIALLKERAMVIHYEQLVQDPEDEAQRICEGLKLDFVPGMIEYGCSDLPHWHFGDQRKVYERACPAVANASKWVRVLDDPQIWRLVSEYLQLLGPETVSQMGYDYQELQQVVEAYRPNWLHRSITFSLPWLLEKSRQERMLWERAMVRMVGSLRQRGFRGTAGAAVRRVVYALSNPE